MLLGRRDVETHGPYRSDAETMERVCANHAGVRALRVVLRYSLLIPRSGPLWQAVLAATLHVCGGQLGPTARCLGLTLRQLRRALDQEPDSTSPAQTGLSIVE